MVCNEGCEATKKAMPELPPALAEAVHNFIHNSFKEGEVGAILTELSACDTEGTIKALEKRYLSRLPFGTAGLRGPMGAGFNCMNDLVVMQTTQGVAVHFRNLYGCAAAKARGFVIGFDGRHNSLRYAHVAAAALLSAGFKVYLNSKVTATPMNPYVIVEKKTLGGIQVTASHNPKNDNGYKLYGANGAQIVPPTDEHITKEILANLDPWKTALELLDAKTGMLKDLSMVIDPYQEAFSNYMEHMTADLVATKARTEASNLKIVYTAMHGVGRVFVEEMMTRFGFKNLIVVKEQGDPDPEFPTVAFPNPEEKGALDIAMRTADANGAPIVIANDPDADRFAAAEKQKDGTWKVFHGDELGILLGYNAYERALAKGIPKEKMLFINSTVSSRMLEKMANVEGAQYEDTMTGFKWMMNRALELQETKGFKPIFVYEEALGYAVNMRVPDKDGITAAGCFVEMACGFYEQGKTVISQLDDLRKKYGYFVSNNSYFLCYEKSAIDSLFQELRNGGNYKRQIGDFKVKRIRDVTTGFDDGQPDNKCLFPLTPTSHMITLYFENGAVLTLRTSGTEPKLKWYSELSASDPAVAKATLQSVVDATIANILQPAKYPLFAPK